MRIAVLMLLMAFPSIALAEGPTASRAELQARIESLRAELAAAETAFLAVSPDDERAYAGLADGGVVRLLPREVFDVPGKLALRGGGAFYSFVGRTHEYGFGSDIELEGGYFVVGFAGCDYGLLARLPDETVAAVDPESPAVRNLAERAVPQDEPGARIEQRRASDGFAIAGVRYASRARAQVGATYVLRSVNYDRSDVLVCFQAVRQDDDGSIVLAWRLLTQNPAPALARSGVPHE